MTKASGPGSSRPTSTVASPTPTAGVAAPVLGILTGDFAHGAGFGQVEPTRVFNGGDPTGDVTGIVWSSWGGPQAVGMGTSDYAGTGPSVAGGTQERVRIVAFDLGVCAGRRMYEAVEWYFPQHGQAFDPGNFEDACTGQYYPPEAGQYEDGGNDGGQGVAHYLISLSGPPPALSGTLEFVSADGSAMTVTGLSGTAGIDGSLRLRATGPADAGAVLDGTWATGEMVLDDCAGLLASPSEGAPSCTFDMTSTR